MNMASLWEQTCAVLSQKMNYVSYSTWVDGNMVPASIQEDTLLVSVKMGPMIPLIQKKYVPMIEESLTDIAGKPMKVRIVTKDELENPDPVPVDNAPRLNPKYTFESFVVGNANRFAHAAALAVAESPAEAYNPLFIYGGVGLGKTHLMQAIGHFIHENEPEKKVLYMTSEQFTNELISAIQQKTTLEFREKIRKVDVLMVDDIQFIAGRESTQQEFFNTFNELHNENKQIILTSDKPPKDIQRLEERLCSRFEWGLVADIQKPDVDTRVAILREKIQQDNISVPDDVLQLIAGKIDSNIRELEGSLTRLVAYSSLVREPITVELCEQALKEIFDQRRQKQVTAELIMQTVSDYYGLTINDLIGPTRKREITVPRQVAMYLTREMTGMSLPQIGNVFGGRDHTTVMHSCKTVEAQMISNPNLKLVVEDIQRLVRNAQ
ncbi:MAG: chromosomal replication initiator protein DnaA [Clostridiales bacterium]|nr:chromosomal replication initiator protein DnaA [Clostridiales bacterium]